MSPRRFVLKGPMNPYHKNDLQIPTYTSGGYLVTNTNGEDVYLSPAGNYSGMEFAEIDFSFVTIRADFSKTSFNHCLFNMTDVSGSNFTEATLHDCLINSSAFMWTDSCKLTITHTIVSEVRFAFSNLTAATIEAEIEESNFGDVNLTASSFVKSKIANCTFEDASCREMSLAQTTLENVNFKNCDLRWLNASHSTADYLTFSHCNLSGSTWTSVLSTSGHWRFHATDLTASHFSMCNAPHSHWTEASLFGVVMERCNWFKGKMNLCVMEKSTLTSVGWNETIFTSVVIQSVDASTLRLRFSQFKNCLLIDSTITDSSWEFCKFHMTDTENLTILNPTHSEGTQWHGGYKPPNDPNPTPKETPRKESE